MFHRLYREPEGGEHQRLMLLISCFVIFAGAFTFLSFAAELGSRLIGLAVTFQGFGFILNAVAELLPKHKIKAAALLRFSALSLMASSAGIAVAGLWFMLE